jgi:hypothetical protein
MEDGLQIILYIIFAIIFIVAKVMKGQDKKKKTPPQRPNINRPQTGTAVNRPTTQTTRKKTFSSFEELIREFERKALGEEEPEIVQPVKKPVQQKIREVENKYEQNPYTTYEGQSLEDTSDYSGTSGQTSEAIYERSFHYTIESEQCNRIAQMLRKPEGIQDAIILSEIINRKY